MAAHTPFFLTIATVGEQLFRGDALRLTCRGSEGELTVLAHHEPLITQLAPGTLTVKDAHDDEREFTIRTGVLEVADNRAVVLVHN